MSKEYNDFNRQKVARLEYEELSPNQPAYIGKGKKKIEIGTVREVITDDFGQKAYVIQSADKKEVSVIYRGSEGPGAKGSAVDWLGNDIPMADKIINGKKGVTPQLATSANTLNNVLANADYKGADIVVYGHSLGSMDAQYALANVKDPSRIKGAYIYQGPNIYGTLTIEQQEKVDGLKYRIQNYVDEKDAIPIGYLPIGSTQAVGIVHHVDSKWSKFNPNLTKTIGDQHLWGGYQYNSDGSLKILDTTSQMETIYSEALDVTATGLYVYEQDKKKFKKSGKGLSSHEKIFLDAEQATVIASGLVSTAETALEEIKTSAQSAVEEAEELWNTTKSMPFGITELTEAELAEAYADGGVTYASIVTKTDNHFDKKITKAEELVTTYTTLKSDIQSGINTMLSKDSELAGEFKKWES
ncbi:triacylglycerol lipase [Streptococcus parauberis]|uniref:triacylglycerol lipase n=1 Tax=Streptococcus parauberis TaxID=1348 RepID=UPI0037952937